MMRGTLQNNNIYACHTHTSRAITTFTIYIIYTTRQGIVRFIIVAANGLANDDRLGELVWGVNFEAHIV